MLADNDVKLSPIFECRYPSLDRLLLVVKQFQIFIDNIALEDRCRLFHAQLTPTLTIDPVEIVEPRMLQLVCRRFLAAIGFTIVLFCLSTLGPIPCGLFLIHLLDACLKPSVLQFSQDQERLSSAYPF